MKVLIGMNLQGALVTVEPNRIRMRVLPLGTRNS